jgi:SAM-dependent MidA family methyltransferase
MQAALYHPEHGYYTNLRGFGSEGDFITSPERHPAFGWLLGRQALDVWEALDRPSRFRILELGGGGGALAESLMGFLRRHVEGVVYTMDEVSPSLRAVQQARLTDPNFRWDKADEPAHFIIANEVADTLPVHRAVVRSGRFHELLVGIDDRDELTFVESDRAPKGMEAYFEGYTPPEGSIVDVCLELKQWVHELASRLQAGVALVIDYAASPPRDSLLTYYRHTLGSDPLVRLGKQDISAHVDMRTLVRLANAEGLRADVIAQRELLFNLGFAQVHPKLTGPTDRQGLAHLGDARAAGGEISALFLVRGLPEYVPAGLVGRAWPEPHGIPSLPPDQDEADFLSQWREAFVGTATINPRCDDDDA